jgi:hypothetical protein
MVKTRIQKRVEKIKEIPIKTKEFGNEAGNASNQVFVKCKVARRKDNFIIMKKGLKATRIKDKNQITIGGY